MEIVNSDPTDPIKQHWDFLNKLELRSEEGLRELEEFLKLIEEKISCEQQKVFILTQLADFPLVHLHDTPFQEIVESIKRKSNNEAAQYKELIVNFEKDIKEELQNEINS